MENGYYTYNSIPNTDSAANYAWFDPSTNRFAVYDGTPTASPYFFPFNQYGSSSGNDNANHYFGMTMTTRFVQQNGGYTTGADTQPVTYEFAGDDDVWVFIDGVLVGDVGGLHGATSLKIEFSTGNIYVGGESDGTLYKKYEAAGKLDTTRWADNGATFADNTYHTLQFFYLERGNYDSNLFLKFNMESTSESSINNVDQNGYGKSGLTFKLYATDESYNVNENAVAYTGTTGANGVLNMVDEDGNNVKLSDLRKDSGTYFVLREINPPEGYRSLGDVRLRFMDNLDILLADNPWQSGSYAAPTVTTTLPRNVYKDGDSTNTPIDTQDPSSLSGTFFAVVLKRNSATDNNTYDWLPVYGDAMTGWHVQEDSNWDSVLAAARQNPYIFAADNTGLRTTIENLPGDLTKYFYILQQNGDSNPEQNAEYTIAYYYTTASTLEGADGSNTIRLDTSRTGDEEILREFSVRVYVPNVKNYLVVQGVSKDGATALSGATFALYESSQVTEMPDGSYVINSNAQPYDTVTTADLSQDRGDIITLNGGGVFPSSASGVLPAGTYYLKELTTPEGYEPSEQVVKIIVDNTGVYADAGAQEDDVTVLRGAGKIVRSMLQFAVPDAINTTLSDITATLNVPQNDAEPGSGVTWMPATDNLGHEQTIDLSYHTSDVPLEYGPTTTEEDTYFVVEEGWSRVTIAQNYNDGSLAHNDGSIQNAGPKENLTGNDLTNLFSRSTVVRVENEAQPCSLTLREIIENPVGNDASQEFEVTLTLKNADNTALSGTYPVTVSGSTSGGATIPSSLQLDSNGSATIQIKLNQDVTIEEIPYGTKFSVVENTTDYYTAAYSVTVMGDVTLDLDRAQGTLTGDGSVTILNTRKAGSVAISNAVEGAMGSYSDEFSYTLKLYDKTADDANLAISGTYQATLTSQDGTPQTVQITFTDGQATQMTPVAAEGGETPQAQDIKLVHGDTLTISGLPAGATCEATEGNSNKGYTTTVDGAVKYTGTAIVSADSTPASIAFTNKREAIVPTGMREENNPYIVMIGLAGMAALVGAAGWVEMRRRKRREEE